MRRFGLILPVLVSALPALSLASPMSARVSSSGLDWLERQAPSFVPEHLDLPPITETMWECDGADATFTQRDTQVDLAIHNFDMSLPSPGVVRLDLTLSVWAAGEAYLDNLYACYGEATCQDWLSIDRARAIVDFTASVDSHGQAHVELANIDLQMSEDDFSVEFEGCAVGELAEGAIGFVQSWGTDFALMLVEQQAREKVGPMLEEMLGGFTKYEGSVGVGEFEARLTGIDLKTTGIEIGADIDVTNRYGNAACVPGDVPEPGALPGATPDLAAGIDSHLAVAVNLGLANDALYHVWGNGLMCITPETLASFGINLDLHAVADLLPGFPAGTTFSLFGNVSTPPRIAGAASNGATLTVVLEGVGVDLIGHLPDGTSKSLHVELDASATATVGLDPNLNALSLTVDTVELDRLELMDDLGLAELGFDTARIRQLLEDRVLPHVMAELGKMPLTGPVFGGMEGVYAILKDVHTTPSHLVAKVDLFRAPTDDFRAPDTTATGPAGPVKPADAKILLGGSDLEVPSELLRYSVTVDGVTAEPTYVRQAKVGEAGVTKVYAVRVAAMDLAGNTDETPAALDLQVDGILPTVGVTTQLRGELDTARPTITWQAADDLTPAELLTAKIRIDSLPLVFGTGQAEFVSEMNIAAGQMTAELSLEPGKQYRTILTVYDQAGNGASQTLIFTVSASASDAEGCGCSAGGTTPAPVVPSLLALALLGIVRIRRRRA
jgi:MYXO-CTERM domain-containing protein